MFHETFCPRVISPGGLSRRIEVAIFPDAEGVGVGVAGVADARATDELKAVVVELLVEAFVLTV
jgi:hypothetical protein